MGPAAEAQAGRIIPVRITLGAPRFKLPYRLVENLRVLAPMRKIFHLEDAQFSDAYSDQLERAGVKEIRSFLAHVQERNPGADVALCCFEDVHAGQICHRRMFADWWFERTGERIPELAEDTVSPGPGDIAAQLKLAPQRTAQRLADDQAVRSAKTAPDSNPGSRNLFRTRYPGIFERGLGVDLGMFAAVRCNVLFTRSLAARRR